MCVSFFTPSTSPWVSHSKIKWTAFPSISNSYDGMILSFIGTSCDYYIFFAILNINNATIIALNGLGTGINSNWYWMFVDHSSKYFKVIRSSIFIPICYFKYTRSSGFVKITSLPWVKSISSIVIPSITFIGPDRNLTHIFSWIPLKTTIATTISHVTVNQLLLWKLYDFSSCFNGMVWFDCSNGREAPAWSARTLLLDWGDNRRIISRPIPFLCW